jgi:7-cyano-7-deazaguanine synthase in queuosine biosynthesis
MTVHLIPKLPRAGKAKLPTIPKKERQVEIELDARLGTKRVGTNTWAVLDAHRLNPALPAVELYRLATLAYTADTRVSRSKAFDGWRRRMILHLPVSDASRWSKARGTAETLLEFLTGDTWEIRPVPYAWKRPTLDAKAWNRGRAFKGSTVSLFSGGLDSLIGAVDLLAAETPTFLVGHFESGGTKKVQSDLAGSIDAKYPKKARLLQFMVQPGSGLTGETENTTRSRSLLFFSLASLVASALGPDARLVLPENGFIALNAPMSPTRLGPLSTRTVHPHTVELFRQLLEELGLRISVEVPYATITKGEMVSACADKNLLKGVAALSMSCAHPTSGRWREKVAFKHCGRCVPCIIRRASMDANTWDTPADYRMDIHQAQSTTANLEDVRAFLLAIERGRTEQPLTSVLRAGPLSERIDEYADVYRRGLAEVDTFLRKRVTHRL